MIHFSCDKKELSIFYNEENEPFITLELKSGTITNKFYIVTEFVEKMSKYLGEDFDEWFEEYLRGGSEKLLINIPIIKHWCDRYIDHLNVNYSKFVNPTKRKNNSIFFDVSEIEAIARFSCYAKIFAFISNSKLCPVKRVFDEAYNELAKDVLKPEIIDKIFKLIQTRTYSYNLSDRYMWDYLEVIQCRGINIHVIEIFNFIMNNIIVLADGTKNPITYFLVVTNESVKWFLRSVYKGTIVYNDSISTQDIYTSSNMMSYAYNDTLGTLKQVAYQYLYKRVENENITQFPQEEYDPVTEFQKKLDKLEYISPVAEYITFPFLHQLTQIPYKHFQTLNPSDVFALSVYLQSYLSSYLKNYTQIVQFLECVPLTKPPLVTTYRIKSIMEFLNKKDFKFYTFRTRVIPYKLISSIVGRLKVPQKSLFTNKRVVADEAQIVKFFCDYFSGKIQLSDDCQHAIRKDLAYFV